MKHSILTLVTGPAILGSIVLFKKGTLQKLKKVSNTIIKQPIQKMNTKPSSTTYNNSRINNNSTINNINNNFKISSKYDSTIKPIPNIPNININKENSQNNIFLKISEMN